MVSFKQLKYALEVQKTLHFRKAAENCHVSQSALSNALNEMEKTLGIQVFERDNKKVLVTPAGAEVLERAEKILLQVNELSHLAESFKDPMSSPLSIGMIPTIAPFLLPKLLPEVEAKYPEAKLTIVEEQSHVLVDMVRKGEIDTAILALPYPCDGLLTFEFWQEDFFWVALKGQEHTAQTEITSKELLDSNLMLLKDGHCLKDHIVDVCSISEATANSGFGATSLNTLIQMVLGGLGTTLIPAMAMDPLISQNKNLAAIHLNEKGPHRSIAFIVRPNYTRTNSVEALSKLAKQSLT